MREVNLFIYFKAFGIQLVSLKTFIAIEVFLYLFAVLYGWGVGFFCKGEELWRRHATASAYTRFRGSMAEDVFRKLHQEEAFLLCVENVGKTLSLFFHKLLDTSAGHEVKILIGTKVAGIGLTYFVFYAPIVIAYHKGMISLVCVTACLQYQAMKLVE